MDIILESRSNCNRRKNEESIKHTDEWRNTKGEKKMEKKFDDKDKLSRRNHLLRVTVYSLCDEQTTVDI